MPKKTKFDQGRLFILNEPTAPRLNPALAQEIGLNESIVFLQLEFWIAIGGKDKVKDGRKWTYQSVSDLHKFFPFWGRATINRIVQSLIKQNLIIIGNYNEYKYDRTRWFTINMEAASQLASVKCGTPLFQNGTPPFQNGTGPAQNGTTIPETTTKITTEDSKSGEAPPSSFHQWQTIIKETKNRPAALREMFGVLYPDHDLPDFGYIGKIARKVGGAGRLAELLWQISTRPPTGDVLSYAMVIAKNGGPNGGNRRRSSKGTGKWTPEEIAAANAEA